MSTNVFATLLVGLVASCGPERVELALGDVHPGVFALVPCWLSDTASPVVTEVNLDAAKVNRNQFGAIRRVRGWVTADAFEGDGFQRYRVLESRPPRYTVEYQENGGGTLTTADVIEVELGSRVIEIHGVATASRVMRVLSIRPLPGG